MPVHALRTSNGGGIVWYRDMGCIAMDGRLLCVEEGSNQTLETLAGAARMGAVGRVTGFRDPLPLWPTKTYAAMISFPAFVDGVCVAMSSCFFIADRGECTRGRRRLEEGRAFVDTINPGFRRVQRWFRMCAGRLRARRQERRLALAMGLGSVGSVFQRLPVDMVLVIALLEEGVRGCVGCGKE